MSQGGSHTAGATFPLQWCRIFCDTNEAHTALKFTFASGDIATGEFKLYKRANA